MEHPSIIQFRDMPCEAVTLSLSFSHLLFLLLAFQALMASCGRYVSHSTSEGAAKHHLECLYEKRSQGADLGFLRGNAENAYSQEGLCLKSSIMNRDGCLPLTNASCRSL